MLGENLLGLAGAVVADVMTTRTDLDREDSQPLRESLHGAYVGPHGGRDVIEEIPAVGAPLGLASHTHRIPLRCADMRPLLLVPPSPKILNDYARCAKAQGLKRPVIMPRKGIFIADIYGDFVAGVGLFDAVDAPFTIAEDAVTNPEKPVVIRHEAAAIAFEAVRAYAMVENRIIMALASSPGIAAMCEKMGFRANPGVSLWLFDQPVLPVRMPPCEKRAGHQEVQRPAQGLPERSPEEPNPGTHDMRDTDEISPAPPPIMMGSAPESKRRGPAGARPRSL